MIGQINLDSEFGRALKSIAQRPDIFNVCEVGTWNGRGSTVCIYEGMRGNPTKHLYSIEGDIDQYNLARGFWKETPNITLLHGTLHRKIMSREEVIYHPRFRYVSDHYRIHYENEVHSVNSAPLVEVPNCDAILLDGGEFSTEGDWETLFHDDLKVVMLDDNNVIKTNRIMNQLLRDSNWTCIRFEPNDRNGWSIFERK